MWFWEGQKQCPEAVRVKHLKKVFRVACFSQFFNRSSRKAESNTDHTVKHAARQNCAPATHFFNRKMRS